MKHITDYHSRPAARSTYLMHRKHWSRQASLMLTQRTLARDPVRRLSCVITCAAYGIKPIR